MNSNFPDELTDFVRETPREAGDEGSVAGALVGCAVEVLLAANLTQEQIEEFARRVASDTAQVLLYRHIPAEITQH